MRQLLTRTDLDEMREAEASVLFLFVGWSKYSSYTKQLCEEAESEATAGAGALNAVRWWMGDISTSETEPAKLLHSWLLQQEQKSDIRMFPSVAMGNGAVVWIRRGKAVSFVANAGLLGTKGILQRTSIRFGSSAQQN